MRALTVTSLTFFQLGVLELISAIVRTEALDDIVSFPSATVSNGSHLQQQARLNHRRMNDDEEQVKVLKLLKSTLFHRMAQALVDAGAFTMSVCIILRQELTADDTIDFRIRDRFVALLHNLGTSDAVGCIWTDLEHELSNHAQARLFIARQIEQPVLEVLWKVFEQIQSRLVPDVTSAGATQQRI